MRITLTLDFEPHPDVPIQAQMHNALLQWMAADVADGCKIFNARQEWGPHGSKATTETQVSAAALSSVNFSKGN